MSLIVNDTAPALTLTLTSDATPVNVTGATCVLHARRADGTPISRSTAVGGSGLTINTPATAGILTYQWQAGDLAVPGNYDFEVQVTYSNGQTQTFGRARQYVEPELA